MKRFIKASKEEFTPLTNEGILNTLKEYGIDTKKAQYELRAQEYTRYEEGSLYTVTFNCPGDWLAYLSMYVHRTPNAKNIVDSYLFRCQEDFDEFVEEYPTVSLIADRASSSWWGDGDDFIIYLKNFTTGQFLYGPEDNQYEEDDWED